MQTTTKAVKQYRHRAATRDPQSCRNQACSRIQNEIRSAVSGAMEVHHALCAPEWQRMGNLEIATRIIPLRHVGGDFVCSLQSCGSTIVILGDLMGKGLPAAMWITHVIDLVHRAAENFDTLPAMMSRLNAELIQSRVRAPLTSAFAMAIDGASSEVSCSSAGHPPAILLGADASTQMLSDGGPLLGVFPAAQYPARTIQLRPGDAIVAFSDGLLELEGEADEQFSLARAARALACHAALGARQKLSALLEASREFAGNRAMDDLSAMVVQHA